MPPKSNSHSVTNNYKKTFKMKWIRKTILILIISISVSDNLFSQINSDIKYLNIRTGFLINADLTSKDFEYGLYIAPSFVLKRHEFFLGPLLTEGHNGLWKKPQFGCEAGYNFYVFKDPMRVNFFLSYFIQYYEHQADDYDHYGFVSQDKFSNTIGFGFNVFIDKKKILSFFNTTGYTLTFNRTKWVGAKADIGFGCNMVAVTFGLSVKVGSINKK